MDFAVFFANAMGVWMRWFSSFLLPFHHDASIEPEERSIEEDSWLHASFTKEIEEENNNEKN